MRLKSLKTFLKLPGFTFVFYVLFILSGWIIHILVDYLPFLDSTVELHATAAILALIVVGLFTVMSRNAARTDVSHLSISHDISYRRVGRNLVHISVNVDSGKTAQGSK